MNGIWSYDINGSDGLNLGLEPFTVTTRFGVAAATHLSQSKLGLT